MIARASLVAATSFVAATTLGQPSDDASEQVVEQAEPQEQSERPWIRLELVGESPLAEDTIADLRALLERDGIAVVITGAERSEPALAVVRVEFRPGTAVSVSVDVRDAVTDKRIGRDLELESVPEDGRSLMIAATADELLDASWAEIALGHWQAADQEPVPEVVSEIVERQLEPPVPELVSVPRLAHRVAGGPAGTWTSGGLGALGATLDYELRFVGRVGLELGGRGFGVLAPRLRSGRVVGGGGMGRLGIVVATRPAPSTATTARFELDVGAYVAVGGLSLTGISESSGVRRRHASPLVELGGTVVPSVFAGDRVRLELPLSVAGLVRGMEVSDGRGPVIAMAGVSVTLGLRVAWISWR